MSVQQSSVFILRDKVGGIVPEVAPQHTMSALQAEAAHWACGELIANAFAHAAIVEKLLRDGFSITKHALGPNLAVND